MFLLLFFSLIFTISLTSSVTKAGSRKTCREVSLTLFPFIHYVKKQREYSSLTEAKCISISSINSFLLLDQDWRASVIVYEFLVILQLRPLIFRSKNCLELPYKMAMQIYLLTLELEVTETLYWASSVFPFEAVPFAWIIKPFPEHGLEPRCLNSQAKMLFTSHTVCFNEH